MAQKTKIFHLITRLIDGGAVNVLTNITTGLTEYDITVGYGSEYDPDCISKLEQSGVKTVQFPLMRHYNPITAVGAVITVSRYLQKYEFDIVHTHSTEAGIIGRTSAHMANVPNVVHTIHGVPFTEDRNNFLNWFIESCEIKVAPWTDATVSIADIISEEYLSRDIGTPNQYHTIYYGIDVNKFQDASPQSDLPGSGTRILMASRLAKGKGFDVLLDAVEAVEYDDFSVLIAGDGPLRDDLKSEIISRGIADRVFLLGYRSDIPSIMAASDIFLLPSYREGTPLVIYEAMAAGLPVIATNIAGIPEQIKNNKSGYLIPVGDHNMLSMKIEDLLINENKRNLFAENSKKRVEDFSVSNMNSNYDLLYKSLLDN